MPFTTANLDAIKAGGWPYWATEDGSIVLVNADCLEVLPVLSGIDAVVTDPPYGIGLTNNDRDGHRSDRWGAIHGDDSQEVGRSVLRHAESIGVPTVAFASPWKPWPGEWRNLIAWDKGGAVGGGGDISTCAKRTWELIQVARNRFVRGGRCESVWRCHMIPDDCSEHICAKPVSLVQRLIWTFTSGMVLDPFMGNAPAGVACLNLGRHFIGIEREPRYYQIAIDRIKKELNRMRLFEKPPSITQRELAI